MKHQTLQADFRVLAATSRPVVVTDASRPDNPIAYANEAFSELCGYPLDEIFGRNCRFLQGPGTDAETQLKIGRAIANGTAVQCDILNYRKDGSTFWNDLTIDPIHDETGRLTGFIGVQNRSDAEHIAGEQRADAETRLASIADHVAGYIYRRVMRADGTIEVTYCSPSIGKLLGIDETKASRTFYDLVHPDDRDVLMTAIRKSAADMTIFREEFRLISANGVAHWLRSDAPPRRLPTGEIVWDGLAIEISAEKKWQTEIADLAMRDPLTGLLNREAWRQAISTRLTAGRGAATSCALLYVDIAQFHHINEQHGAAAGDNVLREVAQRLNALAATVAGAAARLGGDEFALMVPNCAGTAALSRLAMSCSEKLAQPIQVGDQQIIMRTCIGATVDADVDRDKDFLPANAVRDLQAQGDLALRWAKQAGDGTVMLYSREQDDRFQNRAILAAPLDLAIANGELELHYQPLVDLASGRIVSAEALVRWNHPTLGMQRPDLFIPLAEESGLIVQLGQWVFAQAMRQHRIWQQAGLAPPPIAINVSGRQLIEPGFLALIKDALHVTFAEPGDFELELTEGLLIETSSQTLATLRALRIMGFTLTVDDFGSGHASFRYLRDFPVDKLKIDQVFVRQLVPGSTDALIIRAIIAMTQSLGIKCVAEGVETEQQRDFLQDAGCNIGQGYFFSMPLVAEDFAWLLTGDIRLPRH